MRDSRFDQAMPSEKNRRESLNCRHSSFCSHVLWLVVTFVFFLTQMFAFLSRNVLFKYSRPSLCVRLLTCSVCSWSTEATCGAARGTHELSSCLFEQARQLPLQLWCLAYFVQPAVIFL